MKYLAVIFLCLSTLSYGQLSIDKARELTVSYHLGSYTYHEAFIGAKGYGAPLIITSDGGAAAFGSGDWKDGKPTCWLVKLDKDGKEQWQKALHPAGEEDEGQSVAQDKKGNYLVTILQYKGAGGGEGRYGSERIIYLDKTGKVLWDKMLGQYTLLNNPVISYIKLQDDGKVYFRGHVAKEKPAEGKDPVYRFWEGWVDSTGKLTQKSGDAIDWGKDEWQKKFKPD